MTWKKIALELVPPLEQGEDTTPEPWTRKQKLQSFKEKAWGLFHKILRNMDLEGVHENVEDYTLPHCLDAHSDYVTDGLIIRKPSGWSVPNPAALQTRHTADHTPSEEDKDNVIPITAHGHDRPDDPLHSPIWKEYATIRRSILELEGKIPKQPR